MKYIFQGSLMSQVCDECSGPVTNTRIRLYTAELQRDIMVEVAASTKDTITVITEAQLNENFGGKLIGEGSLDANGRFSASLDERYQGGPIRIVAEINAPDGKPSKGGPALVYLTTVMPQWQYTKDQSRAMAAFEYIIPKAFWCSLLESFDLWVICGTVINCKNDNAPQKGVNVTAMDSDIITDDNLGTALTDENGHFRIYYRTEDFKRTFLSPLFNVETPWSRKLGPDVYFIVEDLGGTKLLEETRADGKQDGRRDVNRCFCVRLCVNGEGVTNLPPYEPVWTHVGTQFLISSFMNSNDFDNDGHAIYGGKQFGIYSTVKLKGQVPDPTTGNAFLYRFKVSQPVALSAGLPKNNELPRPAADFITPVQPGSGGYVSGASLGTLFKASPYIKFIPVFLQDDDFVAVPVPGDPSARWIDVQKAAQRALDLASGLSAAERILSNWKWASGNGEMIKMDTRVHSTGFDTVVPGGINAGDSFAPAFKTAVVGIRFETINRTTLAAGDGNGITLNAMVINNSATCAKLELLRGSVPVGYCSQFSKEDVGLAYTVSHPYLKFATVYAQSSDSTYVGYPAGVALGKVIAEASPAPASLSASNPGVLLDPRPNHTCVYNVYLSVGLRLHNGELPHHDFHGDTRQFFYQA